MTGIAAAIAALAIAVPAQASTITFDFDSMAYNSSGTPRNITSAGHNSANNVEDYLNSVWTTAGMSGSVSVSGAGELSNNQYTGDGHVVGPATCTTHSTSGVCTNWSVKPATLGSTNGGVQGSAVVHAVNTTSPDNYIVNSGADRIVITFPTAITSISFDFEIFPDGTCPSSGSCGTGQANLPDFEFLAGTSLTTLAPVTGFPTVYGTWPGASGTYAHSTAYHGAGNERAAQYLGTSGQISLDGGVTMLAFVDWPQRIGIDNLKIDPCVPGTVCNNVPEPPTLPIVALGLGMLALLPRFAKLRRTR